MRLVLVSTDLNILVIKLIKAKHTTLWSSSVWDQALGCIKQKVHCAVIHMSDFGKVECFKRILFRDGQVFCVCLCNCCSVEAHAFAFYSLYNSILFICENNWKKDKLSVCYSAVGGKSPPFCPKDQSVTIGCMCAMVFHFLWTAVVLSTSQHIS